MQTRLSALEILYEVFENNQFSNKLLNRFKQKKQFQDADTNFIFKLVYGTIQYKIYLEYVVNKIIDPEKTETKIQILLWMALYQSKFLKNPNHSVVFETVEVVKLINSKATGFVNVKTKELLEETLWNVDIKNNQNKLALTNGFPFWLYKIFKKDFGIEVADKIVLSSNQPTLISFRINLNKVSEVDFLKQYQELYEIKKSTIARNAFLSSSKILKSEAFENNLIFIQDETSILASEILDPKPGKKILDMCSAPGGKLTHLAQLVGPETVVVGNEIEQKKQKIIEQNLKNADVYNVLLQFKDGKNIENHFDYIMLDAPCSGFGVLKRKPEIKLRKRTALEMSALYQVQKDLLEHAFKILNDGGKILYSTCTINKLENEALIKSFCENEKAASLKYEKQFFGFEGNNNGFYIALIEKSTQAK